MIVSDPHTCTASLIEIGEAKQAPPENQLCLTWAFPKLTNPPIKIVRSIGKFKPGRMVEFPTDDLRFC